MSRSDVECLLDTVVANITTATRMQSRLPPLPSTAEVEKLHKCIHRTRSLLNVCVDDLIEVLENTGQNDVIDATVFDKAFKDAELAVFNVEIDLSLVDTVLRTYSGPPHNVDM